MSTIKDVEFSLKREHLTKEVKAQILKNVVDIIMYSGVSVSVGAIIKDIENFMNNGAQLSSTAREYLEEAVKDLINKEYDKTILLSSNSPQNTEFYKYIDFILLLKELTEHNYIKIESDELAYNFVMFFNDEKYKDPGDEEYMRAKEFFTKLCEVSKYVLSIITDDEEE